jgi:hypothetical protein
VDPESRSIADEARMPDAAAPHLGAGGPDGAIPAARVRAARSRFLPYLVAGGAVACGYLSVVDAGKDHLAAVFGTAVTAGIAAGMAVGWLLLGLYRRRVERSATGHRRVDLAIVLLTVPAYVTAGWTSALVGWAVAVALSRPTPEPGPPNAWPLLIASSLVLYPISSLVDLAGGDDHGSDEIVGPLRVAAGEDVNQASPIRKSPRTTNDRGFPTGTSRRLGSPP